MRKRRNHRRLKFPRGSPPLGGECSRIVLFIDNQLVRCAVIYRRIRHEYLSCIDLCPDYISNWECQPAGSVSRAHLCRALSALAVARGAKRKTIAVTERCHCTSLLWRCRQPSTGYREPARCLLDGSGCRSPTSTASRQGRSTLLHSVECRLISLSKEQRNDAHNS